MAGETLERVTWLWSSSRSKWRITSACLLLFALPLPPILAAGVAPTADLSVEHRLFLEETDLLLKKKERKAFLALEHEHERDRFISAFWKARDPDSSTPENEFREWWSSRVEAARERFEDLSLDRPRTFLLNGVPDGLVENPCQSLLNDIEVWIYERSEQLGQRVVSLFVDPNEIERYRLWQVLDDPEVLVEDRAAFDDTIERFEQRTPLEQEVILTRVGFWLRAGQAETGARIPLGLSSLRMLDLNCRRNDLGCLRSQDGLLYLLIMLYELCPGEVAFAALVTESAAMHKFEPFAPARMTGPSPELLDVEERWLERLSEQSTSIPKGRSTFESELSFAFPGLRGSRTIVEGTITIEDEQLSFDAPAEGTGTFELNGEVFRKGELFETFRYVFEGAARSEHNGTIPLVFQRFLRPGSYRLVVAIRHTDSDTWSRNDLRLEVPKLASDIGTSRDRPDQIEQSLSKIEAQLAASAGALGAGVGIDLEAPDLPFHAGLTRFEAVITGQVARVTFLLDEQTVLSRRRPPYSVELDLGPQPRPRTVTAIAEDEGGRELARDVLEINRGRFRFAVRLIEPMGAESDGDRVLARAEVAVPEGSSLDRVEFFVGEEKAATLFQEPFEQQLTIDSAAPTYVSAVAYLDDGNSTQDVAFVNAPGASDRINVDLIELFFSASRDGRPVLDLDAGLFSVYENGVKRQLMRFEQVEDLPIHFALLLDTSGSMEEELQGVRTGAATFLESAVRPKDRAAVITFHEFPEIRVDFTNDQDALLSGLAGLVPGRGTAFYDSVLYALYQFQGIKGQRALLAMTDGRDRNSRSDFDAALDYARAAGVTIYTISLKGSMKTPVNRRELSELTRATGGSDFVIKSVSELASIYSAIERELRTRYLITYQTTREADDFGFRAIQVRSSDQTIEISTSEGYYP